MLQLTIGAHKGKRVMPVMIEIKRPVARIDPVDLDRIIGRELNRDLENDEPITWDSIR
jgi:sialic acid synthase SpsE